LKKKKGKKKAQKTPLQPPGGQSSGKGGQPTGENVFSGKKAKKKGPVKRTRPGTLDLGNARPTMYLQKETRSRIFYEKENGIREKETYNDPSAHSYSKRELACALRRKERGSTQKPIRKKVTQSSILSQRGGGRLWEKKGKT